MDVSSLSQLSSLLQTGTDFSQQSKSSVTADGSSMFKDVLSGLISDANSTDQAFQADIVKAAAGELDNPHQLLIDSTKSSIALQLVTSVRNNALEAYNEILRMQV